MVDSNDRGRGDQSDTAVAARGKKEHLVFKGVRAQWPTMAEDHRLSGTPVVVINSRPVFGVDSRDGRTLLVP
jgi:hypothetical protein